MLPAITLGDMSDGASRYAVFRCDDVLIATIGKFSANGSHLLFREPRGVAAATELKSVLALCVREVFFLRGVKEMLWVHARRIVAGVANRVAPILRYRGPVVQRPRNAVGANGGEAPSALVSSVDESVAVASFSAAPWPALAPLANVVARFESSEFGFGEAGRVELHGAIIP